MWRGQQSNQMSSEFVTLQECFEEAACSKYPLKRWCYKQQQYKEDTNANRHRAKEKQCPKCLEIRRWGEMTIKSQAVLILLMVKG